VCGLCDRFAGVSWLYPGVAQHAWRSGARMPVSWQILSPTHTFAANEPSALGESLKIKTAQRVRLPRAE
jgi:hypothetical protein